MIQRNTRSGKLYQGLYLLLALVTLSPAFVYAQSGTGSSNTQEVQCGSNYIEGVASVVQYDDKPYLGFPGDLGIDVGRKASDQLDDDLGEDNWSTLDIHGATDQERAEEVSEISLRDAEEKVLHALTIMRNLAEECFIWAEQDQGLLPACPEECPRRSRASHYAQAQGTDVVQLPSSKDSPNKVAKTGLCTIYTHFNCRSALDEVNPL